jgi:methyltransferase family protein
LLAPGGFLLIETPDSGSWMARAMRGLWPPYAPVEHIHLFSHRAIRMALDQVGLETIEVRRHWKVLPVTYVYEMLQNFGPALHRAFGPMYRVLPDFAKHASLPFYVGEMIVLASKPGNG